MIACSVRTQKSLIFNQATSFMTFTFFSSLQVSSCRQHNKWAPWCFVHSVRQQRHFCTDEQSKPSIDPYSLVRDDIATISDDIKRVRNYSYSFSLLNKVLISVFWFLHWCTQHLVTMPSALSEIAQHHFDGKGKLFRPMVVTLMARACNINNRLPSRWVSAPWNLISMHLTIFLCCPHAVVFQPVNGVWPWSQRWSIQQA